MKRRSALSALSDAFRDRLTAQTDWMELTRIANEALVTPALYRALKARSPEQLPKDVAAFFELIDERNADRNLRLRDLAWAAVGALNTAGISPIYLKGMAVWAACDADADYFPRMMSDVDLMVSPQESERAVQVLLSQGFKLLREDWERTPYAVAELWREGDVGLLDLHRRPSGPSSLVELVDLETEAAEINWGGSARIPTPAQQIYLTAIHDLFSDGGIWAGGFDMRHLWDICALVDAPQGVDWIALDRLAPTRLVRNGVSSQLLAAKRLMGAKAPEPVVSRLATRLHYHRLRAQHEWPSLSALLALLGIALEAPNLRENKRFVAPGREADFAFAGNPISRRIRRFGKARSHPNRI